MKPEEIVKLAKKTYQSGVKPFPGALGIYWEYDRWNAGIAGCCGLGAAVLGTGITEDINVLDILGITRCQFQSFAVGFDGGGVFAADDCEWVNAGLLLREWTMDNGLS